MEPLRTRQFVWSLIITTAAFALWLAPGDLLWHFAPGLFVVGNLIEMPRRERSHPLPAAHILWLLTGLAAFVGVIFLLNRWLPEETGASIVRIIRHPLLVVPLWVAITLLTYRRWRGGRGQAENMSAQL